MKKVVLTVVMLIALLNIDAKDCFGYEMSQRSLDSVYVNKDSWVIKKIEEDLIEQKTPSKDPEWKSKVYPMYGCIDDKYPESGAIADILTVNRNKEVGMNVPMGYDDDLEADAELLVTIKFEGVIKDISAAINSPEPTEVGYKFEYWGSFDSDKYMDKIEGLDEAITEAMERKDPYIEGFDFEHDIKIYSLNIRDYTWGYVLVDKDNNQLFWCNHNIRRLKNGRLYRLKDVLDAHEAYIIFRENRNCGRSGDEYLREIAEKEQQIFDRDVQ